MSTPSPKFATKYKFGTKRKRKTPYNFQKCAAVPPPVPDHAENGVLPEVERRRCGRVRPSPPKALLTTAAGLRRRFGTTLQCCSQKICGV
ncbi:hypothetical protein MRX96_005801 [Rhipicephalus microplus]